MLRCLAGLLALDEGRLTLDGQPLDDPAAGVWVPPERRSIGVVFQDYLLFPTLSVTENVAFGLRAQGTSRREAHRRADKLLAQFGLAASARHKPSALSGGQAQRVALARALAPRPRLLLLDEPLAALDVGTRNQVRRDLRELLTGFEGMRLLVTHDPLDARALADRVVVIEDGRVAQQGTLAQVTAHPRSTYVARLGGTNLLRGDAAGDGTRRRRRLRRCVWSSPTAPRGGPVFVSVPPHAVALHQAQPSGSPRNVWPTSVRELDRQGDRVRVLLADPPGLVAEITTLAQVELGLAPGQPLWASVKATELEAYPD